MYVVWRFYFNRLKLDIFNICLYKKDDVQFESLRSGTGGGETFLTVGKIGLTLFGEGSHTFLTIILGKIHKCSVRII